LRIWGFQEEIFNEDKILLNKDKFCYLLINGIKFRIPNAPVCSLFVQHKHSEVVFFRKDLYIAEVRGYECLGESQTFKTVRFQVYVFTFEKTYIPVSTDKRWEMARKNLAPNGEQLLKIQANLLETNDKATERKVFGDQVATENF